VVDNFGQKPAKHGVGLEMQIIENLARGYEDGAEFKKLYG